MEITKAPEPYDSARLVDVDKRRVVKAYEDWRATADLPERGTGRESEKVFYDALIACFHLARRNPPVALGIPKSRAGISNWRRGPNSQTTRLRYDVCEYIRHLSGRDVTSNGFLERESLNISEMAYIGKILVQEERSTSTNEILEFRIDRLEFTMSSARNVNEGDLKPHANSVGSGPTIGTARYVLLEANISLDDGREYEVVGDPLGSEVQLVSDREDTRNVRVVPVLPRTALQTTIKGLKITCRKNGVNGNVPVSVSVDRCHIKPIIELHNEAAVSTREMEAARQNLIDQIFRKRLPGGSKDRLVLSRAVGRSDE